mgnify:CR=1 FL=1
MRQNIYVFSIYKKFFLYDYRKNIIIELYEKTYDVLNRYIQEKEMNQQEEKLLEKIFEYQDIVEDELVISEEKVAYLSFAPVYGCNFRCTYCFGKYGYNYSGIERKFDDESLMEILDYFFYKIYPNMEQYRIDFVSGGEPLLGFDIIKKTVEYVHEFYKKTNKEVSVWLCTNGSLLSEEICKYLSDNKVSIGISLDGVKSKNDNNRKDIYGNGTYDLVTNNISNLLRNKNLTKKFRNIWGLSVAYDENINLVEILKEYNRIGIPNAQIRLVRDGKVHNIKAIINAYSELTEFLISEFKNGNLKYFYMILNDNDQYGKILRRIILNKVITKRCNAGRNKITICPDGTVYPCDSFVGNEKFIMGNIYEGKLLCSKIEKLDIFTIDKCKECNIKFLCGGDCYYNSFLKNGEISNPDKEFCIIQKHILDNCIYLCYLLEKTDKKLFEELRKGTIFRDEYFKQYG